MSKPMRGFQVNTILDRLAVDVLGILDQCLTTAPLDRDKLHLAILVTLSRRVYVSNLLYRDFRLARDSQWYFWDLPDGASARIHEQALVYLHKVLARRPRLARRLRHEPGNMHLLLAALCRHGPARFGWAAAEIRRDANLTARGDAPDFMMPLALELAAQRARLGEDYSDESKRRRGEYGPLWLIRGECAAEVPEELSLFDATDATPVPLEPGFVEDHPLQLLVVRVLDALNERYMLLRGCGLDPETWHDREEPSIARLREMKALRKPAEELLRLSVEDDNAQAYRRVFNELKGGEKLYAGCASFEEFATTEAGMAMLRYASLSLDDTLSSDDDGDEWTRADTLAAEDDVEETVTRRREAGQWIERLIDDRPEWFDPISQYFFREVIGNGRSIHSSLGDAGVLHDPEFQELLAADQELSLLGTAEQAERLYERAEALIKKGLRRSA